MPTILAVETFLRVAELGSFTRTADDLGISRTMASKHVMELEDELGVKLLTRTTRHVSVTEAGEQYLERARSALAMLRDAGDLASEFGSVPKGHLRVSAPLSFGVAHIAPVLTTFRERYPAISIDLELTDRTVDLIDEGYDLALRIGILQDSSLLARKLAPVRRLLCASPGYLAKHGVPTNPPALANHECLVYSYMSEQAEWQLDGPQGRASVVVSGSLRSNNGDVLAKLAAAGHGIINTPSFIAAPYLADGRLVTVLEAFAPPAVALHAIFPPDRKPPLKLRTFVNHLAETFAGVPPWDRICPPPSR